MRRSESGGKGSGGSLSDKDVNDAEAKDLIRSKNVGGRQGGKNPLGWGQVGVPGINLGRLRIETWHIFSETVVVCHRFISERHILWTIIASGFVGKNSDDNKYEISYDRLNMYSGFVTSFCILPEIVISATIGMENSEGNLNLL